MGQSLVKNYLHIVFSTKHRQPLIVPEIEKGLHGYIGKVCNDLNCHVLKIGGYTDHVHIFCMLSKRIALVDLTEEIKKTSSKWVKKQGIEYGNFYWQNGYGAFSVDQRGVEPLVKYIENQHVHHSGQGFQDEFRHLLKIHEVEYDEQYVWG